VVAQRILDVIEHQDAATRIIASSVHEMYGNATACCTVVIEYRVDEWPDLSEIQGCALLRKQTNATFMDGPREGESERLSCADRDRLRLCHTDHVGSKGTCGAIRLGGSPNRVTQHLYDAYRLLVVPRCAWTESGASAVDAQLRQDRE